jgi:amidohydrolase
VTVPADDLARDRLAIDNELVQTRRALHRHPELSFAEHETAALVAAQLRSLGLEPRTGIGGTGVIADLDGRRPGPTLLLRADMDALPLDEVAGRSHGSLIAGVMHACGHDAHTSALLGAARLLCARRARLAGRVRFLFQPAEEIGQGARSVIEDGALDGVDDALGAHVFTPLAFGHVGVRSGEMLVGADMFELAVIGDGGHAATAHESRDAVLAAAQLVVALQAIVARETAPGSMLVLSVASIQGGSATNVVAAEVTLRGTLRWSLPTVREHALARMEQIALGVCQAFRVKHELRLLATVPPLRCAASLVALLADSANACAGTTVVDPGVLPFSEDFGVIAELVPAAYCLIGAAGPGNGMHHAPDFDIDERAIGLTAEVLARAALARLSGQLDPAR